MIQQNSNTEDTADAVWAPVTGAGVSTDFIMIEENRQFTRMTLEIESREYQVTVQYIDMNLSTMIEELIKPLLHAAGFNHETIKEYFDG